MKRADIEHVLRALGSTEFRYSGDWVMTNCPLARWTHSKGKDSRPSFGVQITRGISPVNCFTCDVSGGMLSLIREYSYYALREGLVTQDQIQSLREYVLLAEEDMDVDTDLIVVDQVVIPEWVEEHLGQYHPYLSARGIDEETAMLWNLGFVPSKDFDVERVLFPLYNPAAKRKELSGVIGRSVGGEDPKYRNYPARFAKSRYLYGEHLVPEDTETIIVVEGPIDAIKVNMLLQKEKQFAGMWCVATMGAKASSFQIRKLAGLCTEAVIMYDNDPAGKLGQKSLVEELRNRVVVSLVEWENEGDDPDTVGEKIYDMLENRKLEIECRLKSLLS